MEAQPKIEANVLALELTGNLGLSNFSRRGRLKPASEKDVAKKTENEDPSGDLVCGECRNGPVGGIPKKGRGKPRAREPRNPQGGAAVA